MLAVKVYKVHAAQRLVRALGSPDENLGSTPRRPRLQILGLRQLFGMLSAARRPRLQAFMLFGLGELYRFRP